MSTKPYGKEYADFAETSFSWKAIEEPTVRRMLEQLAKSRKSAFRKSPNVLELGIGSGRLVQNILSVWPLARISGVDISPEMVEITRQRYPDVDVKEGNLQDCFSLQGGSDLVIAHMVLHFLSFEAVLHTLRRVHRQLSSGGAFLLGVPHAARLRPQDYFDQRALESDTPWGSKEICWPRSVGVYCDLLRSANFLILDVDEPQVHLAYSTFPEAKNYLGNPSRLYILARKV